jgi:fimbrial isopeptide formation D2 family protein/LPXTG-motif cell wall-anchored protein
MMKKAIKKLMAALLAVAMVCAMAIPAFAYNPGETEEDLNTKHDYGAFQIFTGDVSEDNTTISNVDWGESITDHHEDFLAKLKEDLTIGNQFSNAKTAQDVLMVISTWDDSDDDSIAFARFVCKYLYPTADAKPEPDDTGHTGGFEIRKPGYYLIVDISPFHEDDFYHAYNSFLLKVTKAPYHVIIKHKVVKPTVEKKVYDNDDESSYGDDNGWGSSADHAINEKFKFQLIAKLPASRDNGRAYDYYDKYTVCFNDTLSAGITFDNLDTVKIANVDGGDPKEITDYTLVKDLHEAGLPSSFKLSIDDVKTCAVAAGLNLNDGATITVTYTAHLNDNATVNTANGSNTTDNKNSVFLQYSNNPRINTSLDKTPTSEACVYTYQLNNTKYHDEVNENNKLEGAGFRLYSNEACNDEDEIKLKKNNDGTYSRDFSTEGKGVEMLSNKDGQFNVKGLDAGTYYLKETNPPTGYSACKVTRVTIKANHTEERVDLDGSTLSTTIINNKSGITLPSTGGIGTTLFYVIGGGLMVAAAVLLITKKRMENK